MSVIWKDQAGRDRMNTWYDRFAEKIPVPVERHTVPTPFGESHLLVTGPETGPPLVCLHAMRTGASFLLSELGSVLTHFRIYAPDLPGQSVCGLDRRLDLKDQSHAKWLAAILDHFGLARVGVFGVSWGGFVARQFACTFPHRVAKLGLMVPAGIVNGSHFRGLMHMVWPMLRYKMRPNEANLRKLLAPILTTWDEDWAGFIGCTINDMKMDPRIPPLATDSDLQQLTMPLLVLAADQDISFPGQKMLQRLKAQVPGAEGELLRECKHCPPCTPEFRGWLGNRLTAFFDDLSPVP